MSTPTPKPWGFDLWLHLHDEHGLTLTESELAEIVRIARAIAPAEAPADPLAGHPELPLTLAGFEIKVDNSLPAGIGFITHEGETVTEVRFSHRPDDSPNMPVRHT